MHQTNLSTSNSKNDSADIILDKEAIGNDNHEPSTKELKKEKSTNNFRKFFLKVFLPIIIVLFASGFIFNILFERVIILGSEICGAYKVNRVLNESDPNEIPIFGASRSQSGFIPDQLGKNFFNYGMDGTGGDVLLMLLDAECSKKDKQNPLIIINMDLEGMHPMTGDICNYLYNSNEKPVKQLLGGEFKWYYNIPFIKYYAQFEMYTKYYLNDRMQLTKFTNKGSSIEKNALTKKKFDEMVEQRRTWVTTFSNDSSMQNQLLSLIKSNPDRIFIFTVSPYHQSYFEKFSNLPEAREYLASLDALKNVKVFDFSDVVYPEEYFVNTTHLNYDGAVAFSKTFKDSLEATFPSYIQK